MPRGRPRKETKEVPKIADSFKGVDMTGIFSMFDKEDVRRRKRLIDWVTFYRRNMEMFVQHYLKIKLFPYQKIFIHFLPCLITCAI